MDQYLNSYIRHLTSEKNSVQRWPRSSVFKCFKKSNGQLKCAQFNVPHFKFFSLLMAMNEQRTYAFDDNKRIPNLIWRKWNILTNVIGIACTIGKKIRDVIIIMLYCVIATICKTQLMSKLTQFDWQISSDVSLMYLNYFPVKQNCNILEK